MDFISGKYNLFLLAVVALYYLLPLKRRWYALLAGSLLFYVINMGWATLIFLAMILLSYFGGRMVEHTQRASRGWVRKAALWLALSAVVLPLLVAKNANFVLNAFFGRKGFSWIVLLGMSFFTMQMIAYLVDLYRGKIRAQRNLLKYTLFISFFPQIIQGPIPRYEQLADQLVEGHRFEEKRFIKGLHLILWGFFLKLMIADKAAVIVNTVFGQSEMYQGTYVLLAGVLYSFQLYADFLSCVTLAQGAAALFGISLVDNFRRPYFSTSIKEFWGRWHLSLSSWLRDYIYIPLGGNRKGKLRKYLNLIITFLVSGLWHGAGYKYLFWGCMHAGYQILGELTLPFRDRLYGALGFEPQSRAKQIFRQFFTFLLVMLAWIVFRADSLSTAFSMIASIFTVYNPWILFGNALFGLGLSWRECLVLVASLLLLYKVSRMQEKFCIRERVLAQPVIVRYLIYLCAIFAILIFGTYGHGYDAQSFIYGGF